MVLGETMSGEMGLKLFSKNTLGSESSGLVSEES
jgi:hypothetical protein